MSEAEICSQCGWAFDVEALRNNACKKCKSAIIITSIHHLEKFEKTAVQKYITQYSQKLRSDPENKEALLAIGICYLKLELFDLASKFLKKCIDLYPEDSSGYYYEAICLLKGKRPRTASLNIIREAEHLASTAIVLDGTTGRNELLLASLRHDYYILNGMKVPQPDPESLFLSASKNNIDILEYEQLLNLLKIPSENALRNIFK